MTRLVVVSNRVADLDASGSASKGGLATAMSSALREHGGLWFGWSGNVGKESDTRPHITTHDNVRVARIDLDQRAVDEYYNGFANRTLWPLCHYRMDLAAYERSFTATYVEVNRAFAAALAPLLREDDVLWVHDYHLVPLASALRALGVRSRIGFFLHIPWPASQIIATLPRHHEMVQSMFDYDLIGFQTQDWLKAFEGYVVDELKGRIENDGCLTAFGRTVVARPYPIGLDVDEMLDLTTSDRAKTGCHELLEGADGRKILLGVDRIDYTKGLPQKFLAYEQFLRDFPDQAQNAVLFQIGQPSRTDVHDYRSLHDHLQAEAGRINGDFGTLSWAPLRYRSQSLSRDTLAGVYRAADVALVTPLRDGMNLVAKEYVAAQDPEDPGVLILSRFAGAAAQMREALIVNPYSREDMADAIHRALEMPLGERTARWKALYAGVRRDDLTAWKDAFLADLMIQPKSDAGTEPGTQPTYPEADRR